MSLKRIHLEVARSREFPEGSHTQGYDFVAPLNEAGHLQADIWRHERQQCRVRRFWGDTPDEVGLLVHKRGGAWAFDYDPGSSDDDEPGFKFDRHCFVPGEYVSIKEHDGVQRTFRVVSVRDLR
jgi:hypothetical protein